MSQGAARTPELRALTGARGLAAWLVVLYHVRAAIPGIPASAEAILAKGYLAVDFFFLLSGFVIWLTWHDRLRERGSVAIFLRRRVARIWPLHATMLAAALLLALALRVTGRHDPAFPIADLPIHLLLLQTWGLGDPLSWNDPAWSISAEAAAYLTFPLLAVTFDWRRWSAPMLVAAAGAFLLALHIAMRDQAALGSDIARFGVLRCLAEFGTGGIVCALWLKRPRRIVLPATIGAALMAGWALGLPETLAVPAAFAALLLALAGSSGRRGNPLESRLLHRLGEISYATYLSHFLLWKAFKLAFVGGPVTPWQVVAYLLLVLVTSALLYDRVELPAQRWLNRISLRRSSPRPALR